MVFDLEKTASRYAMIDVYVGYQAIANHLPSSLFVFRGVVARESLRKADARAGFGRFVITPVITK